MRCPYCNSDDCSRDCLWYPLDAPPPCRKCPPELRSGAFWAYFITLFGLAIGVGLILLAILYPS